MYQYRSNFMCNRTGDTWCLILFVMISKKIGFDILLKMEEGYKLRCCIVGHEKDVRAVSPTLFPNDGIISGSRDVTARVWIPNEYIFSLFSLYMFCFVITD